MLNLAIVVLIGIVVLYIWNNKTMENTDQKNQVVSFFKANNELESKKEPNETSQSYSKEYKWREKSSDCRKRSLTIAIWLQCSAPPWKHLPKIFKREVQPNGADNIDCNWGYNSCSPGCRN